MCTENCLNDACLQHRWPLTIDKMGAHLMMCSRRAAPVQSLAGCWGAVIANANQLCFALCVEVVSNGCHGARAPRKVQHTMHACMPCAPPGLPSWMITLQWLRARNLAQQLGDALL